MRITNNNSRLRVALNVLREIDIPSKDAVIRTFSNCREQGLHVTYYASDSEYPHRCVSFSENRRSDDIIVMFGMSDQFADSGIPYEDNSDIWEKRKYFKEGEFKKAEDEVLKFNTDICILCGGGSKNTFLVERIKVLMPNIEVAIAAHADEIEAMTFAWLAYKRLHHEKVNLKEVTGASENAVLGGIYA